MREIKGLKEYAERISEWIEDSWTTDNCGHVSYTDMKKLENIVKEMKGDSVNAQR